VELRCPDPACNPYLELALCLAAGLDGIKNQIVPPPSVDSNIFVMTAAERKAKGVDNLPGSLAEALVELSNSPLMREVLGGHVFEKYTEAKWEEWDSFRTTVTEWEIDRYLLAH
jgi:glutamine synthetase